MIVANEEAEIDDSNYGPVYQMYAFRAREHYPEELVAELAAARTSRDLMGKESLYEWDGQWPAVRDGEIVRTPAYRQMRRRLEAGF